MARLLPILLFWGCATAPPAVVTVSAPPPPSADQLYLEAERFYQAGDFERTGVLCAEALEIDARHAPAFALLTEVKFILGSGKPDQRAMSLARLSQFDALLEEGRRQLFFGSLDYAEDCARSAFNLAEMLPPEMDVDLRLHQVQALREWIRYFQEER